MFLKHKYGSQRAMETRLPRQDSKPSLSSKLALKNYQTRLRSCSLMAFKQQEKLWKEQGPQ